MGALTAALAETKARNAAERDGYRTATLEAVAKGPGTEVEIYERIGWRHRNRKRVAHQLRTLVSEGVLLAEPQARPGFGRGVTVYRVRQGDEKSLAAVRADHSELDARILAVLRASRRDMPAGEVAAAVGSRETKTALARIKTRLEAMRRAGVLTGRRVAAHALGGGSHPRTHYRLVEGSR